MKLLNNIAGNIKGGLATGITSIPQVIGYGLLVFAPLGKEYIVFGVLAGLYGAIITCIVATLFGSSSTQITGPNAPLSLLMLGNLTILAGVFSNHLSVTHVFFLIGWLSVTVILAGLFQIIFSSLKLGQLIKYTPYPVVIGFLTGVGLLLIVKQFEIFMGTHHLNNDLLFFERLLHVQPFTIVIGLITIVIIYLTKRLTKHIPGVLAAIIIGTALYYLIKTLLPNAELGGVIGTIPSNIPKLEVWHGFFSQFNLANDAKVIPYVLLSALIMALIASLITLLSALSVDLELDQRHDSNKELRGQGMANVLAGLSGSLVAAGSAPRSFININSGGRGRLSSLTCGFLMLFIILFAKPLIELLPEIVVAAVIIQVGISMINIKLFKRKWQVIRQVENKAEYVSDLLIVLLVTILTVTVNLTAAILIGIIIAAGFYIQKMGKLTIRRESTALDRQSKKMRPKKYSEILKEAGSKIEIIELQGSLFFGSAETLAMRIESMLSAKECFIIDFKRVIDIDSTGVMALQRLYNRLTYRNKKVFFSYVNQNEAIYLHMLHSDFIKHVGAEKFFADTDRALEYAEDYLLKQKVGSIEYEQFALNKVQIFKKLSQDEFNILSKDLEQQTYSANEAIFKINDTSRNIYILTQGSVILERFEPDGSSIRLLTIKPGVIFGEMSFLLNAPRTASATAEANVAVCVLSYKNFQRLQKTHPKIALKILEYISTELVLRLTTTSIQMAHLELE